MPRSSRQSDHTKTFYNGKEMQTAVVWSCLLFIRSSQNHLARHSGRGKKTRQTEEWIGLEFAKSQRAVENRKKMEETGCEIICDLALVISTFHQ